MPDIVLIPHENLIHIEWHRVWPSPVGDFWCFTGGRDFANKLLVWDALDGIHESNHIGGIGVGCARGVDAFVLDWAKRKHIPIMRYVADWDRFGEAAGTIRNGVMLEDFEPDFLGVFPGGTGTTNCAKQARKLGIERKFFGAETDPFAEALKWG